MSDSASQTVPAIQSLTPPTMPKSDPSAIYTGYTINGQPSDVINVAKRRMQLSREYTQPYFDRFLDNYKHYFIRTIDEAIEADAEAYPFYSNLMLPINYQIVETILPRMFSRLPNFTIKTEQDNDEQSEMALKELIRYQMTHPYLIDDPIFLRLVNGLKEQFITGNSWGIVPWYKKEAEVLEWQPYSPELGLNDPSWNHLEQIQYFGLAPQWKLVKVKKKLIDAPVYQNKSVFHVFPDPKKKRVSDLGWEIEEDYLSYDEIWDMINAAPRYFKNIEAFKTMEGWKGNADSTKQTNYDQELAGIFSSNDYTFKDDTQKQYKVWTMREPGKLCIIINEQLLLREGDNPNGDGKLGLLLGKDIPIPHELYAWGEPDPIKKIEDAMSDQANMRNDNVFYDLMRMWKLNPESLVDGEEFVPEPGTVVQMTDLDGLQPLDTGNTKPSAYREYDEWEKIIQNVSGVSDYATGQVAPGMNKTAAGVEGLQAAANARFGMKLNLFENLTLKAVGTMYVQRNMRFFDDPQPLNTEKGKTVITPTQLRMIRGNVYFQVDAGSTDSENRNTEVKKWSTLVPMLGKPPFDNLTQKAQDEWGKKLLFSLGEQDVETLMEKNAPVAVLPGGIPTGAGAPGSGTIPGQPGQTGQPGQPGAQPAQPPVQGVTNGQNTQPSQTGVQTVQ
jgi:hypothetical protein